MATTTPNLGLTKPDPDGDDDAWAPMLNGNADILDTQVKAAQIAAAAANANAGGRVSKSGDMMTGALNIGASVALPGSAISGNLGVGVNAHTLYLDYAGHLAFNGYVDRTGTPVWKRLASGYAGAMWCSNNAPGGLVLSAYAVGATGSTVTGSSPAWTFSPDGAIHMPGGTRWQDAPDQSTYYLTGSHAQKFDKNAAQFQWLGGTAYNTLLMSLDNAGNLVANGRGRFATGCSFNPDSSYIAYEQPGARIFQYAPAWYWAWDTTNGNLYWNTHAAGVFQFQGNGNFVAPQNAFKPGGGAWADSSDERFKERIAPYSTGLSAVLRLRPKVYSFKAATGRDPERRYIGAVAQDAEGAMPEMVSTGRQALGEIALDDARTLDPSALPWALVNAIQELHAIIEAQATRIAALEAAR